MAANPYSRYKFLAVLLGAGSLLAAIGLFSLDFFRGLEYKTLDLRFRLRPNIPQHPAILHVDIDDKSILKIGSWPWTRDIHAHTIRALKFLGARAIVLDIEFLEPSPSREEIDENDVQRFEEAVESIDAPDEQKRQRALSDLRLLGHKMLPYARKLEDPARRDLVVQILRDRDPDQLLSNAIRESACVYVPIGFRDHPYPSVNDNVFATSSYSRHGTVIRPERKGMIIPIPEVASFARGFGAVDMPAADVDGIYRRVPVAFHHEGRIFLQMGVKVALDLLETGSKDVEITESGVRARTKEGTLFIPTDWNGNTLINWAAASYEQMFDHIPYGTVVEASQALRTETEDDDYKIAPVRRKVEGKVVFIGAYARAAADFKSTPLSPLMPGVAVHSNMANAVLQRQFLREWGTWSGIAVMALVGTVSVLICTFLRPVYVGPAELLVIAGYTGVALVAFTGGGIVMPVAGPVTAALLPFLTVLPFRFITEEKIKKTIKKTFELFLDQSIVEELIRQPNIVREPKKVHAAVMFTDIEGFSGFAERTPPMDAVRDLNIYLTRVTETILYYGGYLDKYLGDGTMAIFGIRPGLEPKLAARNACRAALKIVEDLRGPSPFRFGRTRIGICSGEIVCGLIGAENRADYTAVGDVVNVASRLQGLNKETGTQILVDQNTYSLVKDEFKFLPLGPKKVHGRVEAVNVYSLEGSL